MICSASHSDEMMMCSEDIQRAIYLLAEVEVKMGTVFKGMGRSDLSGLISDSVIYFTTSKIKEIPLWQYAKHFEGDMDKFMMERVLMTLEAMKAIKLIKRPGADTLICVTDQSV